MQRETTGNQILLGSTEKPSENEDNHSNQSADSRRAKGQSSRAQMVKKMMLGSVLVAISLSLVGLAVFTVDLTIKVRDQAEKMATFEALLLQQGPRQYNTTFSTTARNEEKMIESLENTNQSLVDLQNSFEDQQKSLTDLENSLQEMKVSMKSIFDGCYDDRSICTMTPIEEIRYSRACYTPYVKASISVSNNSIFVQYVMQSILITSLTIYYMYIGH